ncbi:Gfo/Idh/MocA family oxidoreductase [Streptomyces sp. 8K308]|uniref:Gfo/Idh/MocA family protein n=1 Tax=Streptomyces sp. 8K308 TaxID=2530388 RepID=UPI00104FA39F|nr:Gfo/Idh/MocA family oxidoreductase [Streptomyces sp. 8K308]TDC26333.1 Gfo/Idh/MocA family oxidoreductase [Streptomyces sp. 8K308]
MNDSILTDGELAEPLPLVLAGARGHGRWHLRNISRLAERGVVRLAGICELAPLEPAEFDLPGLDPARVEQSADLGELLAGTGARVAVVCTPIQTHEELGLLAARHGVHLLLEKPPTPSMAAFEQLAAGVAKAGTACQIGFQSLGSHAVEAIRGLVADGAIGAVRGFGAAGAWVRDEAYWRRAPWGGHRTLDGRDVVDGVLTNALAHATATALRIEGSDRVEDIAGVDLELYRVNDIAADDTSAARIRTTAGGLIVTTVTLCAERPGEPYVVVHGERGRITFWYKADEVRIERDGHEPETVRHGRTDLLENLVAHLRDGEPLLVPLERTGAFTRLVEAVRTAPEPVELPADAWRGEPGENGPRRLIPGIDELTARGAAELAGYAELGAPWAGKGWGSA